MKTEGYYGNGSENIALEVATWAREAAAPNVRIVLAGFSGDYDLPGWREVSWTRPQSRSAKSRDRECLYVSPHCLGADVDAQPEAPPEIVEAW
jgi:hypothetical protein